MRAEEEARAQGFREGIEAAAQAAWRLYMDTCRARNLHPANNEHWLASTTIRALLPADAPDELAMINGLKEEPKVNQTDPYSPKTGEPIKQRMRQMAHAIESLYPWTEKQVVALLDEGADELAAANATIEVLRAQCKTQLDAIPGIVASARADALAESADEIAKLHAQVERLWKALTAAENGFERLHNALLGTGPKQACGEMADYFLTEARTAIAAMRGAK